jgi:hypothetical protein
MAIKIARGAAGHYNDTNFGVAREILQRRSERVTHLRVKVHSLCAA